VNSLIQWEDEEGTTTLHNDKAYEGSRFSNWNPDVMPVGPGVNRLSDARLHKFRFRTDNLVSFEIRQIPNYFQERALRLMEHLRNGGLCTVVTGDAVGNVYAGCGLAPDTEPDFQMSDAESIEYTLALTLRGPVKFIALYGGVGGGGSSGDDGLPPSLIQLIDPSILVGSPGVGEGSLINSVSDPIGGFHVTSSGTERPTFTEDGLNGYPALEFGTDDKMDSAAVMIPTDGSTIIGAFARTGAHVEHSTFFRMLPLDGGGCGDNDGRLVETHGSDTVSGYTNRLHWNMGPVLSEDPEHISTIPFIFALRFQNAATAFPYYNETGFASFGPAACLQALSGLRLGTGFNGKFYRWEWHQGQSDLLVQQRVAYFRARFGF
jgi:hypothetical protein